MRFRYLTPVILLLVSGCNKHKLSEMSREEILEFHNSLITIDSHVDTPLQFTRPGFNFGERHDPYSSGSKSDIPRMKEGMLDGVFMAVFLGQGERSDSGNIMAELKAREIFDSVYSVASQFSDKIGIARTPEELYENAGRGKHSFLIGVENGYAIGNNLSLIDSFYNMGARYITLCHTRNNDICDSSNDSTEHGGLSAFGAEVVKRMNRLGMMIDLSHASDSTFYDVLRLSTVPVIASHSCARALCNNPRNLDDEMLRALAKNGGVIQMCILSAYVKEPAPNPERDSAKQAVREKHGDYFKLNREKKQAFLEDWYAVDREHPEILATVEDVVDHIDHIVEIAGIDHVGIGTDFDGGGGVEGCFDVSQLPGITEELIRRGYSEKEIRKIWGENLLRVMKKTGRKI